MRLAILSDIHANLEALTEVFKAVDERSVESIVCLGDIVGYGANPNECVELIAQRCSTVLMGNHDAAALDLAQADHFTQYARVSAHWTADQLQLRNKEFLQGLPLTVVEGDMRLVHASPCEPAEWYYIVSHFDARQAFKCFSEQICFVGHSHVPGVFGETSSRRQVEKGERFVVNVGSVGQPRDTNAKASFGIFDSRLWRYEHIRVEYDAAEAGRKIIDAGLPRALAERLHAGL